MDAVRGGHSEIVSALLKAGCNVNARDMYGRTALFYALHFEASSFPVKKNDERLEVIKSLLEAGIDVNIRDRAGMTVLHHAVSPNYFVIPSAVKLLLEAGADVSISDDFGMTVLMYSVRGVVRNIGCIETILEAGSDVNAKDKKGRTAMFYAEYPEAVKILADAGAEDCVDSDGKNALVYAAGHRDSQLIDALLDAGFAVKSADNDGKKAFDYALSNPKLHSRAFMRLMRLNK